MRNALRLAAALLLAVSAASAAPAGDIAWTGWSDAAFARAKAERRLVLLDLGAVWCHWCHVMDETTYRDPRVVAVIERHFVAVRVDQDARPDLSNRYEDYGWPATIVFDARGTELVKFAGYVPPERMLSLLEAVVADPTPGPSAREASGVRHREAGRAALSSALRKELVALLSDRYDREKGGWGFAKKFLDWDAVAWCLERARGGDADSATMARETLAASRKLVDPVWGGLYQYSDSGDWDHPHFEKLAQFQAEGMRAYAQAYALWGDAADLDAARAIHRYVRAFLGSPEGAFYVSQDADLVAGEHSGEYYALGDAGRRARGIPPVDTHLYARENGWMVQGLVALYAASGDAGALDEAVAAARWIASERALPGGGFRHDSAGDGGPYLGDTVAVGRAFLALYAATGEREWLERAKPAADFAARTFAAKDRVGLVSAAAAGRFAPPVPQRDENVAAARFANLLFRYTGRASDRRLAETAMRFLARPDVARRFSTASVLLADAELASEPAHMTVVGARSDARSRELLAVALADPGAYKRVELWDRAEGPLPNPDVEFPDLERPAAFACSGTRCSLPAFTAAELKARVERLTAK
jgi:uncharacterized protein YyaL (SSP411 family)